MVFSIDLPLAGVPLERDARVLGIFDIEIAFALPPKPKMAVWFLFCSALKDLSP